MSTALAYSLSKKLRLAVARLEVPTLPPTYYYCYSTATLLLLYWLTHYSYVLSAHSSSCRYFCQLDAELAPVMMQMISV